MSLCRQLGSKKQNKNKSKKKVVITWLGVFQDLEKARRPENSATEEAKSMEEAYLQKAEKASGCLAGLKKGISLMKAVKLINIGGVDRYFR